MLDSELTSFFPGKPESAVRVTRDFKVVATEGLISGLVDLLDDHMRRLRSIGLDSLVVGLSGGVDSAVGCVLAQRSLFPATAVIIEMDVEDGMSPDVLASIRLAERIGIRYEVVNAAAVYREHLALFGRDTTVARVHLRSRVITSVIFQYADNHASAVIDTTDKSEEILKIYEESFRGHLAPLAGLFKSELYDVADLVGLAELRSIRSGCPELVDFDAFGMEWEDLDTLLYLLTVEHETIESLGDRYGVDQGWLRGLLARIEHQPLRTTSAKLVR